MSMSMELPAPQLSNACSPVMLRYHTVRRALDRPAALPIGMLLPLLRSSTLSGALSILLLCGQVSLPWLTSTFATQDGPSHLHTAAAFESLVLHSKGPYRVAYSVQSGLTTNWGTSALITLLEYVFGKNHTEQILWSLILTVLYTGMVVLVRALGGSWNGLHPFTNFLILPWFLWIGFYNFVLGIGICLLLLAYFQQVAPRMTWRDARVLWLLSAALFLVHVMPFFLAIIGWAVILLVQFVLARRGGTAGFPARVALLSLLPILILFALYLHNAGSSELISVAGFDDLLRRFPMHAFASSFTPVGEGFYVYSVLGALIILSIAASRRRDLFSSSVAAVLLTAISLSLYFLVPNTAFNGDEVKIRFAWVSFLFGACALYCHRWFPRVAAPAAVYATVLVSLGMVEAYRINIKATGQAVAEVLDVLNAIPAGAFAVRLKFPTGQTRAHYGFHYSALEPLYHVESLSASRRRWVSISDYQPLTRLFPVVLKNTIADNHRFELWELEDGARRGMELLFYLDRNLGVPLQYVLLVGDAGDPGLRNARAHMEGSHDYNLIRTDSRSAFVFLYARRVP